MKRVALRPALRAHRTPGLAITCGDVTGAEKSRLFRTVRGPVRGPVAGVNGCSHGEETGETTGSMSRVEERW